MPQNVVMIGEKVFTRVIKLKWGHEGGPWSSMTGVLIRKGNLGTRETDM